MAPIILESKRKLTIFDQTTEIKSRTVSKIRISDQNITFSVSRFQNPKRTPRKKSFEVLHSIFGKSRAISPLCHGGKVSTGRSLIGSGISAELVVGCLGSTTSTVSLTAGIISTTGSVVNSRGVSGGGCSEAIIANIVNGCSASGTISSNYKYNTP